MSIPRALLVSIATEHCRHAYVEHMHVRNGTLRTKNHSSNELPLRSLTRDTRIRRFPQVSAGPRRLRRLLGGA